MVVAATRSVAILASPEEATQRWGEAVAAHERWGHRIELAHTLRARAEYFLALGSEAELAAATDDLERAAHLFTQSGAPAMALWCASLDNSARSEEQRRLASPAVELTNREREIVDLLRMGATNKEVAHKLGVSVKTVEAHLRNLFRRNGVRNRAELVGRLRR